MTRGGSVAQLPLASRGRSVSFTPKAFLHPGKQPPMTPSARTALASWGALRHAAIRPLSTTRHLARKPPAQKPPILEKPAKFNPPSHPSRQARKQAPRHYGGSLSKEELEAQERKDYPTMMAPQGTWAHWFWTNKLIHVYIMTVRQRLSPPLCRA